MRFEIGKISIYGSKRDVEKAKEVLSKISLEGLSEGQARLKIQDAIHKHDLKAWILYDGNTVYNMHRILSNLKRIMEHGTLYDPKHPRYIPVGSMLRMPAIGKTILSPYFYRFLINECGSIAHYNIRGWVAEYPTVEDLKEFFKKNEYGKPVREDIPGWKPDTLRIVEEIEKILFPFQHFLKARREE